MYHPTIKSYQQASEYIGAKSDRPLHGRSTRLVRVDVSTIAVRYHRTNIVTFCADGNVILNSNGYRTSTTKSKINEYAPRNFGLYQRSGVWYVWTRNADTLEPISSGIFADNMVIKPNGKMTGILKESASKKTLKLANKIKAYSKKYVDALIAGKVSAPSGADCWICAGMLGDDNSHLLSHIKENYFVPRLAYNAMDTMGASLMTRQTVYEIWNNGQTHDTFVQWLRRDLVKIIRRYLRLKLGIAN
jgi:hypothetical protein